MSLCPGYLQVNAFGPDDDYEEEEEIFYVTLELGNVEPALIPSSSWDGAQRSAQDVVGYGTAVLWCNTPEHAVSYMESTRQRICFREVRLEEKGKAKAKADACQLVLDRITGKIAPLPRRRRTRKMDVVPEDY
ncbi:uncharacterized protein ARMOST_10134 [Armillaria ostoyae]|uniref:Transcription factor TFIIIC triple barrel domain-containing protein n=1 Tax=Armillaria ostoyae TaxID=47428 RepID=A0A284RDF1_ARMOS|nr:uncharacterized protein ARMOST_10134 [Armillaria ostoyae]